MKKLLLIILITVVGILFTQTTDARQRGLENPPPKIFYRNPDEFKGKERPFRIEEIKYYTNFKGSNSKNSYQIQIIGTVNKKPYKALYTAGSIEELEYYKKVFSGNYKKILLYGRKYKSGGEIYFDSSIVVTF